MPSPSRDPCNNPDTYKPHSKTVNLWPSMQTSGTAPLGSSWALTLAALLARTLGRCCVSSGCNRLHRLQDEAACSMQHEAGCSMKQHTPAISLVLIVPHHAGKQPSAKPPLSQLQLGDERLDPFNSSYKHDFAPPLSGGEVLRSPLRSKVPRQPGDFAHLYASAERRCGPYALLVCFCACPAKSAGPVVHQRQSGLRSKVPRQPGTCAHFHAFAKRCPPNREGEAVMLVVLQLRQPGCLACRASWVTVPLVLLSSRVSWEQGCSAASPLSAAALGPYVSEAAYASRVHCLRLAWLQGAPAPGAGAHEGAHRWQDGLCLCVSEKCCLLALALSAALLYCSCKL